MSALKALCSPCDIRWGRRRLGTCSSIAAALVLVSSLWLGADSNRVDASIGCGPYTKCTTGIFCPLYCGIAFNTCYAMSGPVVVGGTTYNPQSARITILYGGDWCEDTGTSGNCMPSGEAKDCYLITYYSDASCTTPMVSDIKKLTGC